ncbi:MAG: hypothetical protein KF878_14995 [Planctomycetes bacterium]|nr:hypothetical protein [Planctomycetota bacterium]
MTLAARAGSPARCALCHDDLVEAPPPCTGCRTLVHPDCRAGEPCPTLGCALGRTVWARAIPSEPRPRRRRWWPEVLIGAAFGGWCLAVVVVNLMGTSCGPRVERGRADFYALHDAADRFKLARGRYPERMHELHDFLREYSPVDPWGNLYVLLPHVRGVAFVSPGPDGALDTDDDLDSRDLFERAW